MKYPTGWTLFCSLLLAGVPALAQQEPITVYFTERPPFMARQPDGSLKGIVATPALQAFDKAGLTYEVHEASPARQFRDLKDNHKRICSLGWYSSPERRAFAKLSKPVYQDLGIVGVAHPEFRPEAGISVATLLADPNTRVLLKDTMVYGPYLDAQLTSMRAKVATTTAEFSQLLRMIQGGRAQLTFLPLEEAQYYVRSAGYAEADFNLIHFPEMSPGEARYVMCSMQVDDATMAKINAGLGK